MSYGDLLSDWSAELEARRVTVLRVLALIGFLLLAATALRNPGDYDLWWHLRMGMDWMENGLSPWVDHYSFTFPGAPVTDPPVAFQALLWKLTDWLGERGAQVSYKIACFLGVFLLMLARFRQVRAPALVALIILPLLVGALQIRVMVRPELVSYVLAMLALLVYTRTRLQLTVRAMWPIPVLLGAWTLYHSAILGYVIFFGLFLDIALRLWRERGQPRQWAAWVGWGALAFAAGFVDGDLGHPALAALGFSAGQTGDWGEYIAEFRPTWEGLRNVSLLGQIVPFLLLAAALLAMALAIVQRRVGYLVILVVFTWFGIRMNRMLTPAAIVDLAILTHLLSVTGARSWLANLGLRRRNALILIAIAVAGFTIVSDVRNVRFYFKENRYSWARVPEALVSHMESQYPGGNIFNVYQMGGFLLYRLSPEWKIYIDGRTNILYPWSHALQHQEALISPVALRKEVERYDIGYTVLEALQSNAELMWHTGFELDFADVSYALFRRENGSYPEIGRLWAMPYCLAPERLNTLLSEIENADQQQPPLAATRPLTTFIQALARSADPADGIRAYPRQQLASVSSIRLYAFQALKYGLPELALEQLGRLSEPAPKDRLAMVMAQLDLGDLPAARHSMVTVLGGLKDWRNAEILDFVILEALLETLASRGAPVPTEPGLLEELAQQTAGRSLAEIGLPLTAERFCLGAQ